MFNLDALIDDAITFGEVSAGTDMRWLAQDTDGRKIAVFANHRRKVERRTAWTPNEDQFVRDNVLLLSDAEIGEALGRTAEAVHIRRERHLRLPARTLTEDWPTMRATARLLGVKCGKTIRRFIDLGLLPGHTLPIDRDSFTVIPKPAIVRFSVNPMNWIYFDPARVADPSIRRLVDLRRQRWQDAWWSTGQAATYHGVSVGAIHSAIMRGDIPAKRWDNWYVLRSDAVRLRIRSGKGAYETWAPAQDRYIVTARAVGLSYSTIERMAKVRHVYARLNTLYKRGDLSDVANRVGVACRGSQLYADFRHTSIRFPMLESAAQRLANGAPLTNQDINNLAGVFAAWLQWYAETDEQGDLARRLAARSVRTDKGAQDLYRQMISFGFKPFEKG